MALTKDAGGGKLGDGGQRGACLAVWQLPSDPFAAARRGLGALAAPANPQNPFHHAYVYGKAPRAGDSLLPLSAACRSSDGGGDPGPGARAPRPELLLATESSVEVPFENTHTHTHTNTA